MTRTIWCTGANVSTLNSNCPRNMRCVSLNCSPRGMGISSVSFRYHTALTIGRCFIRIEGLTCGSFENIAGCVPDVRNGHPGVQSRGACLLPNQDTIFKSIDSISCKPRPREIQILQHQPYLVSNYLTSYEKCLRKPLTHSCETLYTRLQYPQKVIQTRILFGPQEAPLVFGLERRVT